MSTIKKIMDKSTQTEFDKKVLSAVQHLHAYIKHRLYIAESTGVLPRNMYTSNDIIDEGIAKHYSKGINIDLEEMAIKLDLFKIVDNDLNELLKKEAFHKNTQSTSTILEEELDSLEENFTLDADMDYVMNEDLEDISYQQDNKHKHLFLYDDNNSSVISALEMEDISTQHTKKLLGKFYTWLPMNITDVVDLFVFGKLSFEDISKIKDIEIKRIERIFESVQKSFRKNLP
ncbi:hypothetical protein MWU58_09510 [Flavobacteriaceae bacterium S0825]|uniref:hypothetical protein n=1 Tax=Gaetbulibacter sp. S0825 TaxID=2720084 RepID=UPI00142FB13A|nr:hypothetical protein [Gaetbulibacter sp. S0825]MCK0109530.1 hypothetical protein [Flavobacteriaceae bacterium S0825]NIX65164.1 hypothetical protein [Gaetbulibacter sp. S0825]